MFAKTPVLLLALTALPLGRSQDYFSRSENRRRGSVDEDAGDYVYEDYDEGNGLQGGPPAQQIIEKPPPPPPNRYQSPSRRFKPQGSKGSGGLSSPYSKGREECKNGFRTVAHEEQCDLYYECYEGQGFLQSCPNGLVYTGGQSFGLIGVCDYPHHSNCVGREGRNPPQSTEHCDWLYGIFGHETSCTRYWTCWNGTATEQFCIGGLLYNEETHACDWPQNVAGCQKHPLCKDDANGNVPLGKSCNRYWQCQGGYPRLQRCPAMLVFDKNRRRCVTPPTEDCEVPTTKAPPPEEEGDFSGPGSSGSGPRQQQSPNPRRGGGGPRRQAQRPERQQPERQLEPQQPFNLPEGFSIPEGAKPIVNQN